ncbi:hypothetical protein AHAS_Ahas03G0369300 [Arachis hypogaea]
MNVACGSVYMLHEIQRIQWLYITVYYLIVYLCWQSIPCFLRECNAIIHFKLFCNTDLDNEEYLILE